MEQCTKIINVDVNDPAAMTRWAHGMCRNQSVEHLASVYNVEPTLTAVVAEISRYFPDKTRQVVVKACEAELSKTEARERGRGGSDGTEIPSPLPSHPLGWTQLLVSGCFDRLTW